MEAKAILRTARISPQKARLVADQVRGLPAERAVNLLKFSDKKAAHLIKKVVFPLQILPWSCVLAAGVQLLLGGAILLVLHVLGLGTPPVSALALPLVWLPLLPLCLGGGWLLAAVGVYIRDIGHVVGMVVGALVFISPVFFPIEALPGKVQQWMWLNPLAPIMTQTRAVLLQGVWPDWSQWGLSLLGCSALALLGAAVFHRLRQGFADVL